MQFEPGQRVALVHTCDPCTHLRPGDRGTVRRFDADQQRVSVTWDSGSTLAMLLDDGDELAPVPASAADADTGPSAERQTLFDAARVAGADDGAAAAEWWLQDTIGGRAAGDTTNAARRILAGIDDGDPAVLDRLPDPHVWTTTAEHPDAPSGWTDTVAAIRGGYRRQAADAYHDGYTTAVADTVTAACRRMLHPTGDDRDLSHLHPDHITLGRVGVFAGDWNDAGPDASFPLTAGYVGVLIDRWNGWAVFACTRAVAEAIVVDQQQSRDAYRAYLTGVVGVSGPDLDRRTDQAYCRIWWDGEVIVVDSTGLSGDPDAVERIGPDDEGRYVVMGRSWCWQAVDPYDCARIVGELPDPDRSQEWVLLTHTPDTRVPPDPYTVTSLETYGAVLGYTGALCHRGDPIARIVGIGTPGVPPGRGGPAARLATTGARFDAAGWQAYVAAARRCGEPMTEATVLDALAQETLLGQSADAVVARGDTLVRLLDGAGTIRTLLRIGPIASTPEAFDALRHQVRADHPDPHGATWQYWTGRAWRHLTNADTDASQPPPASGAARSPSRTGGVRPHVWRMGAPPTPRVRP